jgi:hypothetical protein
MGIQDRLRAKKPPENDERWSKCEILETEDDKARVKDSQTGENIQVQLTEELVKLFESRMDDETAWYIKRN